MIRIVVDLKGGLMHYGYWFYGGHMLWMTISWLIGIGLFSMLIWLLVSAINRGPGSSSPEEILRRRYAAGEIESEEYERRLGELLKTKSAA
jgi:putative membrane protein